MKHLRARTSSKNQVLDLTEQIQAELPRAGSGVLLVTVAHTTCGVTTADLDPGTDLDLLNALRHLLPELRYHHPHDPQHTPDHILASLVGSSLSLPFDSGRLVLGTWQRIILVELDGPRERDLYLSFLME